MLGALGILAYAASMMTHEALGHGGYCLALGGHNVMLTAWGEGCSSQPPGIEAAGPGVQFGAGLLAWLVLHRLPQGTARLRYFFWLYMVFNLLVSSGYVAFSGCLLYTSRDLREADATKTQTEDKPERNRPEVHASYPLDHHPPPCLS